MGFLDSVKKAASSTYKKIDSSVGGRLPGGVPSKSSTPTTSTSSRDISELTTPASKTLTQQVEQARGQSIAPSKTVSTRTSSGGGRSSSRSSSVTSAATTTVPIATRDISELTKTGEQVLGEKVGVSQAKAMKEAPKFAEYGILTGIQKPTTLKESAEQRLSSADVAPTDTYGRIDQKYFGGALPGGTLSLSQRKEKALKNLEADWDKQSIAQRGLYEAEAAKASSKEEAQQLYDKHLTQHEQAFTSYINEADIIASKEGLIGSAEKSFEEKARSGRSASTGLYLFGAPEDRKPLKVERAKAEEEWFAPKTYQEGVVFKPIREGRLESEKGAFEKVTDWAKTSAQPSRDVYASEKYLFDDSQRVSSYSDVLSVGAKSATSSIISKMPFVKTIINPKKASSEFIMKPYGFVEGWSSTLQEKPLQTAAIVGVSAAVGGGSALLSGTKTGAALSSSKALQVTGYAITGAWGASVGKEYITASDPYAKAKVLGKATLEGGAAVAGYKAGRFIGLKAAKLSPRYVPIEETNIKWMDEFTEPYSRKDILKLQGKTDTRVHVSTDPKFTKGLLKQEFTVEGAPKAKMEGWRADLGLDYMYYSAEGQGYLAYAGVSPKGYSGSSTKPFQWFSTKPTAFVVKEPLAVYPKGVTSKSVTGVKTWLDVNPTKGKFWLAPQNVGVPPISTEGQVIAPVGTQFKVTGKPKFTIFSQYKTPPTYLVDKPVARATWDFFTATETPIDIWGGSMGGITSATAVSRIKPSVQTKAPSTPKYSSAGTSYSSARMYNPLSLSMRSSSMYKPPKPISYAPKSTSSSNKALRSLRISSRSSSGISALSMSSSRSSALSSLSPLSSFSGLSMQSPSRSSTRSSRSYSQRSSSGSSIFGSSSMYSSPPIPMSLIGFMGGGRRKAIRQKRGYAPSLSALALDIRAPKAKPLGKITGLELRPVVS